MDEKRLQEIEAAFGGMDETQTGDPGGWWETSDEAEFGAEKLGLVRALVAEVRRLRPGAERYQRLRECRWDSAPLCVVTYPKHCVKLGAYCPSRSLLDAAIDAAMNEAAPAAEPADLTPAGTPWNPGEKEAFRLFCERGKSNA